MDTRSGVARTEEETSTAVDKTVEDTEENEEVNTDALCGICSEVLGEDLKKKFTLDCGDEFHKECLHHLVASNQISLDEGPNSIKVSCPVCKMYIIKDDEVLRFNEYDIDYVMRTETHDHTELVLLKWSGYDQPSYIRLAKLPGHHFVNYLMKKKCLECSYSVSFTGKKLECPTISIHNVFLYQCDNYLCGEKYLFSLNGEVRLNESIITRSDTKLMYSDVKEDK